jgi:hypothetical protein
MHESGLYAILFPPHLFSRSSSTLSSTTELPATHPSGSISMEVRDPTQLGPVDIILDSLAIAMVINMA